MGMCFDLKVCARRWLTALSFPMTLALAFYKLRLVTSLRGAGEVRVILIGAAARTEERLLLETGYWAEAGHLLPTIDGLHLCFVGPEVRRSDRYSDMLDDMRIVTFRVRGGR